MMNHCQLKKQNKIAIPPLEIRKHRNTIGIPSPKISSEIVRVFKRIREVTRTLICVLQFHSQFRDKTMCR